MAAKNSKLSTAQREALSLRMKERHAARKASGLPAPSGLPYATPPAAEAAVPAPGIDLTPLYDQPQPAPGIYPTPPLTSAKIDETHDALMKSPSATLLTPTLPPRAAFTVWLRGKEGRSASDTRMSSDAVRFGAELEDRLWLAWQAGLEEGRTK